MENENAKNSLRVLHCGDITLGTPHAGLSLDKCRECYTQFRTVFDSLFETVKKEEVDIVLIAGNLYSRYLTNDDATYLIKHFAALPSCHFVISPGVLDPYLEDSFYASGRLPQNVHVFESEQLERIDFPALNTSVYGWANLAQRIFTSPIRQKTVADEGRFNLLCGCCEIGARSVYCSVLPEEIGRFGADYAAFSNDPATEIKTIGHSRYAHCGPLEGKSFEESGVGSVILIDLAQNGAEKSFSARRIPLSLHRYETISLDVTGVSDMEEVFALLRPLIEEKGWGSDTSLRVILNGALSPVVTLRPEKEDADVLSLYSLEFIDRTLPTHEVAMFKKDMTVRGELYRMLEGRLSSPSVDERTAVAQAFRTGLAALESKDITIV